MRRHDQMSTKIIPPISFYHLEIKVVINRININSKIDLKEYHPIDDKNIRHSQLDMQIVSLKIKFDN